MLIRTVKVLLDRTEISCDFEPFATGPKHDLGIAIALIGHGTKHTSIEQYVENLYSLYRNTCLEVKSTTQ